MQGFFNLLKTKNTYFFKCLVIFMFAVLLPIKISLSNFFLILYFVISLFTIIKGKKRSINPLFYYSPVLLFIPLIIGFFYTTYMDNAIHDIIKKNSFLLIPLFLSFETKYNLKKLSYFAKRGLLLGVITSLLFLIINVLYRFVIINKESELINLFNFNYTRYNFTNILKIHPTYFGIYILFSMVLILKLYYEKRIKIIPFTVLSVLFTIGILFINQRIIFILFGLLILFFIFYFLKTQVQKKAYLKFLIVTVLLIFIGFISFSKIKKTYVYYRFTKELNWEFSDKINSFYIKEKGQVSDPRLARWKGIVNLINEKPLFGFGAGSETQVLGKMFKEKGMINSYNKKYNTHNQYLSVLVEFGFFGFLFFLFFLLSNLYFSIKYKNIEFISVLTILIMVGLVENILSRNNGITFFTFFVSLYLFQSLSTKKIK